MVEKNSPWQKASKIDSWSRETDPSSIAGDEWVDADQERAVTASDIEEKVKRPVGERFMHPQHDVES
jgi:hypothetical protein